eukprot:TRINITY_DN47747_c0_g1_i1.p3 TRINITY_DN47747_c0_g1~~TRINITY_DN47747_c0_g1_i1.p3  ORF type:complete len:121 (-),score=6.44 TRINITY_DN47747_c0_g1_i1:28-390(-)
MADAYFLILEDMPLAQQRRHHEIFNALTGELGLTGSPLFLTIKTGPIDGKQLEGTATPCTHPPLCVLFFLRAPAAATPPAQAFQHPELQIQLICRTPSPRIRLAQYTVVNQLIDVAQGRV